jgi:hypothetical protein
LLFNPVDRITVPRGALAPIAKLGKAFERGFVTIQVKPADQDFYWVYFCLLCN